jgi:energy-coupling factor transporter ATP-binding protein EcfA2
MARKARIGGAMFDSARLHGELMHLHRQLSLLASEPRGRHLTEGLVQAPTTTPIGLVRQALFADCLRVLHSAVLADSKMKDEELSAIYPFVSVVARHYSAMNVAHYGDVDALDNVSVRDFLSRYSLDDGPCGRAAAARWPALLLCKKAQDLGVLEPLERYQQLMTWLIPAACEVGHIKEDDPGRRGKIEEIIELRRSLGAGSAQPRGGDQRATAFLRPTRVFSAVQQASSIYSPDPFDVETIHLEARHVFEGMIRRATSEQHTDRGRMLLILGDSGAGKTHLLRSFRRRVHEYGRGFVVYAQMHTSSDNYARYLLQNVIDALSKSYSGIPGERSGLVELVSGLAELGEGALRSDIEKLTNNNWDGEESTTAFISNLADRLTDELAGFDIALLRVLLYSLSPTPGILARVYKYLRCQAMTPEDYKRIGVAKPSESELTPEHMIHQLGKFAYLTRRRALVLMIDQAESGFDATARPFQQAADTLQDIVSRLPSAVAVISCLSDLWDAVRGHITKATLDRLEKDPTVQTLRIDRTYPEIAAIVSRRLAWLYAEAKVPYLSENPLYPFTAERMRLFEGHRTRTVLEWCHQYQERCADARRILSFDKDGEDGAIVDAAPTPEADEVSQIAMAWNDAAHSATLELPDDGDDAEGETLAILSATAKLLAAEGLTVTVPPLKNGVLKVQLTNGDQHHELAIAVTNKTYRAGAFTNQIEALGRAAKGATAVAVRTSAFPRGPASEKVVTKLVNAGGRAEHLELSTLRDLVAYTRFHPNFPPERIAEWRLRDRPISSIPVMARIFNLEPSLATDGTVVPIVDRTSGPVTAGAVRDSQPKLETSASMPPGQPPKKRGRPSKAQPKQ